MRTETTVRHTKCGRMRGMVVGEGGRSSGVLLYLQCGCPFNGRPLSVMQYSTCESSPSDSVVVDSVPVHGDVTYSL